MSNADYAAPGPSAPPAQRSTLPKKTGIPIVDMASMLGPPGDTFGEELKKLADFMKQSGNKVGPATPVIFAKHARALFVLAKKTSANGALSPYDKCVCLFRIFDTLVLVYKNVSCVYCDNAGTRSVFGYSNTALKNLLSRIEAMAGRVADYVHDAFSLTALTSILATAQQRLSQVHTDRDMLEFFRSVSGGTDSGPTATPSGVRSLPRGIELYTDSHPEAWRLVERLYATNADKNYIREFHDCMFLLATGNARAGLSTALETRLADKDRNIVLFQAPGDRLFASSMCASAISLLRKKLEVVGTPTRINAYRINYGRIFSKYRGESERNFDEMMEWIKNKVRSDDTFSIFWFPDIENFMAPRTSNDPEHMTAIKNSMLQHMDVFNKDRTLRSFLLLFNASEGELDSAFSRRLETVVTTPWNPLTDYSIAAQVVGAELARYHINVTDGLAHRLATEAGPGTWNTRVGGFAYVQGALRELYLNQKLVLSSDARAVLTEGNAAVLNEVVGRYIQPGSLDTLYDLDERPVAIITVSRVAFSPAASLATLINGESVVSIKYNATLRGDPKNIDGLTASRTCFLHDV